MARINTKLVLTPVLPLLVLTLSFAQSQGLPIDSEHSTASLTLLSSSGPGSLNVGIAKVSGTVKLDSTNPAEDTFDLYIYPARQGARLLNRDGSFRQNAFADLSRYTLMSFHSDRTVPNPDGRLEITGELTITYIERQANISWNNAYSGAPYGEAIARTASHKITFILDRQSAAAIRNFRANEISAQALVTRQDFPDLRDALLDAVWPIVIEDEHCEMPQRAPSMRDYVGAICTGTPVQVHTGTQSGQYYFGLDYPGPIQPSAPSGDKATILLQLHWVRQTSSNPQ